MLRTVFAAIVLSAWAVMVSCSSAVAGQGLTGTSLPGDFKVFSADSPWNTAIAPDAALHPDSAAMIDALATKAGQLKGDMTQWTVPLFVVDAAVSPKYSVRSPKEALHPSVDPEGRGVAENIPLPEGLWPDPKKDGHMLIVDPKLRKTWDLARAKRLADGSWKATRLAVWNLDGLGFDPPFTGKRWWMRGARGSGMPLIAGLIRPEEIQTGEIRHALSFAAPTTRKSSSPGGPKELCSPVASRTDGKHEGRQYLPEGVRIQLDPALDLDSLGLSPQTRILARAMQVYGMYLCDHGDTFKIYFQNLGPDRGRWKGIGEFRDLARIPVKSFRVLGCNTVRK
ncbi:hypothetical protein [Desulfovibrio ferrophilus]|uniref:Phosphodiester glycosidase domain-containing protein n=1 Tax=Desulfovibrio ferrophilus TaxID=241368 RepID=A0A2Z6B168_9BACT|nr:hypothetical protein [Desulfovibrio ferrophilus]BBD09252.1 uncharacterized protein DFE_2526 [Desulfovibrio ferrophilus]